MGVLISDSGISCSSIILWGKWKLPLLKKLLARTYPVTFLQAPKWSRIVASSFNAFL